MADLSNKTRNALDAASSAISRSNTAKAEADITSGIVSQANGAAERAKSASSDALTLARGARRQVDSLEGEIKSAKQSLIELGPRRVSLSSGTVRDRLVAGLRPLAEQKFAVVASGTEYSAAQVEESSL